MAETINLEMTEEEAIQLMDEYLDKIKKIREEMARDQIEIEQYRAETRAIIDRLNRKAA